MDRVSSLHESRKTFVASQAAQNHNMIRTKFQSQTSTHLAQVRNIGWVNSQNGSRKFTTRVTQNICCITGRAKSQHNWHEVLIPSINPPEVCGLEGHVCGSLDCVKTLEKQHKQLTVLFGNVVMKARTETELIADCHGGTDVNLVTALGFYSMFGSLESLLNLEQKHEMVTAISVEVFPGVLQTEQKYIGKWREAIETEMNIRHSETYCRPSGARYLVGSMLAPMCKSKYPVHFVAVDVKSTRTIVDQAFSVPKCVRLARMSEKSYELLCKMFSAVPERTKEELESILGKKFMGYVSGNFSDFEKQKQRGSTVTDYNAVDENDEIHRVMMEVEPLLEASGKRNWRSIMLTHDEFPCHCLLQTWWYPKRSNLVLIWDSGELLSMGLPDSSQPITIVIVGVMMAIRWLEAHVRENNRQEAPTREQL